MSDDRRRFRRVDVQLPATVFVRNRQRELAADVVNLSEGGAFIEAEGTLERDFQVELRIDDGDREHRASGRVVRKTDQPKGGGIEFIDVDTDIRDFVRQLLSLADDVHTEALRDDDD
jgi:c-di-GMP-binding flagellar brake protein YcgR